MLSLICYLFPAFISLRIYQNIVKDSKSAIVDYGVFVALNNVATLVVFRMMRNGELLLIGDNDMTTYSLYMLISIIFAIFMPLFVKYVSQNFAIDIKVTEKPKTLSERRAEKKAEREGKTKE